MPLSGLELFKGDEPCTLASILVAISRAHRTIPRASSYCALMALAISSTETYVHHTHYSSVQPFYEMVTPEYKRRTVLRSAQEERRKSTDGLLPGLFA